MLLEQVILRATEEPMSVTLSWESGGRGWGAVAASVTMGGQGVDGQPLAEVNLCKGLRQSILSPEQVCGVCVWLGWTVNLGPRLQMTNQREAA